MNASYIFMNANIPISIVNQRGMITIPHNIRKKNHIEIGSEIGILELDGVITLIPIQTEDIFSKDLIPHEEMIKIYEKAKKQDIENEM